PAVAASHPVPAEEIESWLTQQIGARLRLAPGDVQVTTSFLELGMGSLDAVEIAAALERWLGRHLSPTAVYNYPTIEALARWLAIPVSANGAAVSPPPHVARPPVGLDSDQLLVEVRGMTDRDIEGFLAQELAKQRRK